MGAPGGALTLAADDQSRLVDALARQRAGWDARPLVRELYRGWHRRAVDALSPVSGPTIELGCGVGAFKETHPPALATDVAPTPWAEEVLDAEQLDLSDLSVANLVLIDVLHHLAHPSRFLAEAERVLAPGGRIVMVEPYSSPVAHYFYRRLHFEGAEMRMDPFRETGLSASDPMDANNALATLAFWRHLESFEAEHPGLVVVARERFGVLLYPLSGGLTGRPLTPLWAVRPLRALERALSPLAAALAFRCLVVLERR